VAAEEVVRMDLAGIRHNLAEAAGRIQALAVQAFHSLAGIRHNLEVAASHTRHKHNAGVATQADPTFEEAYRSQCKSLGEATTSVAVLRLRAFDRELEREAFQVKAAMVVLEELLLKWI